ncbi:helix-turn-helix domain-containing protein [Devosia sp. CN2-171]|jgi:AraC family transcriptional regulator|uniref:AraC family transcriptional regulator n=1 Tax=Devosia sp. CN2-171 TaxID=3400909 RepID=UPI003BF864C3
MSPQMRAMPPEGASYYRAGFFRQALLNGDLVVARTFQHERRAMRDSSHTAETFGIQDAILCTVHLRHMDPGHTWWDGRHLPTSEMTEGSVHVHDLRYNWTSELVDAFDCVHFSFPQSLLRKVVLEGRPDARIEIAAPSFEAGRSDDTLLHLARSLLPGLARPQEVNRLFADHVIAAAASHFAATYGSVRVTDRWRGRLAPWQEARVLEYLAAHLDTDISISELAAICRQSPSHFARAFRATMGMPPHRFLLGKRVGRAMELLTHQEIPLSEIAVACGFADQSHLTRVFSRTVGVSPGRWRQQRKS